MFYGLRENAVDTEGLSFRHELADIETLNARALSGELAITAISFHAYAYLADRYLLLPHGASFGDGYGPCVVAREAADAPRRSPRSTGRRVAIPGALTTAALALRLRVPGAIPVVDPRSTASARPSTRGEVDAGVVIHEGQLTWKDEGFRLLGDLGALWKEETAPPAPARRQRRAQRPRRGDDRASVSRALGRSIEYALAHREDALTDAMRFARGLPREKADRFVGDVRERLDPVLRRARARGRAPSSGSRPRGGALPRARDAGVGGGAERGQEAERSWR